MFGNKSRFIWWVSCLNAGRLCNHRVPIGELLTACHIQIRKKTFFCKSLAINWTCMALNDVWVTFLYRIRDQLEEKLIFPLENWVPSWLRCHLCPWWVVGYHHWSVCVDGGWFSIQLIATNDVKTAATATRITCCWIISFRTGRG